MAATDAVDVVWVDVLPSLAGFVPAMRVGLAGADGVAITAGGSAGVSFGKAFGDAAATSVEAASTKVAASSKRLADAQGQVTVAQARLNDVMNAGNASAGRLAAAQETLSKAERNVELQTQAVNTAKTQQARVETAAADASAVSAKRMDAAAGSAGVFGKAVDGANKAYGLMASAMALSLPIIPLAAAVKSAGDFQQSLTKLVTTAGAGQDQVNALGSGMLKMAGQVGIGANQLAAGMYTVESSLSASETGAKRTSDALLILKASAEGARQEGASLGNVVDAVTTLLHDYHLPATDAANVTSQLITAVSHGKLSFDDFTGALHSVTPVASALHIPLADIAGSLAAMTSSGESAQQATENMRNALMSLAAPTKPMIDELAQLGITATQLSDDLSSKGLSGTMQEISQAILDHMGPAGKVLLDSMNQSKIAATDMRQEIASMPPALAKLSQGLLDGTVSVAEYRKAAMAMGGTAGATGLQFLSLYKSSDGFNSLLKAGGPTVQSYELALQKATGTTAGLSVALQLSGSNAVATNAAIKDIAGSAAQADGNIKGWADVQGNFNQKMAEAKAALGAMGIEAGQHLLPALTALAGWIAGSMVPGMEAFAGKVGDAWTALKNFANAHSTLMGALGAAAGVLAAAVAGYTGISKGVDLAKTAIEGLLGSWKLLTALVAANPFTVAVAGVAALAAGLIYAYQHSATFRDEVSKLGGVFSGLVPAAKGLLDAVVGLVEAGFKAIEPVLPTIVDLFKQLLTVGENLGGAVLKTVAGLVAALGAAFLALAPVVLDVAKALLNAATAVLPALLVPLKLVVDAADLLAKGFAAIPGPVLLVGAALATLQLTTHLNAIEGIQFAVLSLKGAFSALASGVGTAVQAVVGRLGALKTAYTEAAAAGRFEAEIQGAGQLEQSISGMVSGVTGSLGSLSSSAESLATKGFGGLKAAAGGFISLLGGPWGVALLAATGGIALFVESIQRHNAAVEKATQDVTSYYKAIAQGGQPAVDAQEKLRAKEEELSAAQAKLTQLTQQGEQANTSGARAGSALNGVIETQRAKVNDLNGELTNGQKAYQNWYNALSPMEQLTQNVTRAQNDLELAVSKYGPTSDQAKAAAILYQGALSQQKLAQDQVNASEKTEVQTLQDVADKKLASVSSTLQAKDADLQAKDAIDQYNAALQAGQTPTTQLAQMNNELAQQILGAAQAAGQAAADEAAANGVKDTSAAKNKAMLDSLQKYEAELTGPAKQAIDDAITALQGVVTAQSNVGTATDTTSGKIGDFHAATNLHMQAAALIFGTTTGAITGDLGNVQANLNGPTAQALGTWQTNATGANTIIDASFNTMATTATGRLGDVQANINGPTAQALQAFSGAGTTSTGIINTVFSSMRDTVGQKLLDVQNNINGPTTQALQALATTSTSNTGIMSADFSTSRDTVGQKLLDIQNNINGPTAQALQALATTSTTNTSIMSAVFSTSRDTVGQKLLDVQNNINGPTTQALDALATTSTTNTGIVSAVFSASRDVVGQKLLDIQNNLNGPTTVALNALDTTTGRVTTSIQTAFNNMNTGVVGAVKSTVTNTSAAWNLIVPAIGNPVGTVVNTILNRGLFPAFNAVSTAVAAPAVINAVSFATPSTTILQAAAGGEIPGPYIGPTADNVLGYIPFGNGGAAPIRVNPREWIHPVDSVNYYGPQVMAAMQKRQISREALGAAMMMDREGVHGMAQGGYVSGTWRPTPEQGQYLVGDKVARRTRHFLDALNQGQAEAVQAAGGWDAIGPRFFYGGAADALSAGKAVAQSMNGQPYVWGGVGPGGADCSGYQSAITNGLRGFNNPFFRVGTTATFPWAGFSPGLNGAYAVGSTPNAGGGIGHMAGTLSGVNVESGGVHNNVAYGGPAAGADASLFNIHAFLPQVGGAFVSGGGGGGATVMVPQLLAGKWADEAAVFAYLQGSYAASNNALPTQYPPPRAQLTSFQGVAPTELQHGWDGYLKARVDAWFAAHPPVATTTGGTGGTTAGAAPANISGNVALGQQLATGSGWGSGAEWNSLYALWQRESGWNNLAQNPTSTAYGIPQFLDSTWATVGYTKTSDPATQIKAGLAYIKGRYGDPNAAWGHETSAGWYSKGGQVGDPSVFDNGGLWKDNVVGLNKTGGTERVLTPPQDRYFRDFVDTSRVQQQRAAGPAQFVGDLYLDSGEFLGKVRGIAVQEMDSRDAAAARDLRSAV